MVTITTPESFTSTTHAATEHTSAMIKDGTIAIADLAEEVIALAFVLGGG